MKKFFAFLVVASLPYLFPSNAFAHSFGKLYSLPVPFWMYLYGGIAAIVASFLIIGYFLNKTTATTSYPTYDLSRVWLFRFLISTKFIDFLKIMSVFLFILTLLTGIIGSEIASFNMTFFWIVFILGFTYLTAVVGNVYSFINPLKVLTQLTERAFGTKIKGFYKYPRLLGYYPALFFYILFIWVELFAQTTPLSLSIILIQYSIITILGVFSVGKNSWFEYCDFFSVFFRLVGKIAPIEYSGSSSKNKKVKLFLRPPFVGLLKDSPDHFSLILFVLFMVSSTSFDGLKDTVPWTSLYWGTLDHGMSQVFGDASYQIFQTAGLVLSPLVFFTIYVFFIYLTKIITKHKKGIKDLSCAFIYTIIPIALVYNIAHYYTLVATDGLNIVSLMSDPFGYGWNIFGTADWFSGITAIDTNFVWHSQVALILIGHIVSVYLAHIVAVKIFPTHKKAIFSQIPMLFIMVAFTAIGLWVLSQPITSGQKFDAANTPQQMDQAPQNNEMPMLMPQN